MVESQNFTCDFTQNTAIFDFKRSTFVFIFKIPMAVFKKISSPQFLSYDHQNFLGATLEDLDGRHVFIFSIFTEKKFLNIFWSHL